MADEKEKKSKKVTSEKDKKTIATSLKRFELSKETEQPRRKLALEDLKFRAGEQWPEDVKAQREEDGRACITINVLPARERQILNNQRQNRPAIDVHPVDDKADKETAKVMKGMVRHIEVDSNADAAYDTATAAAVRTGGPGWFRVKKEYETPFTRNQVLKIDLIRNQFMVYCDPNAQKPDRSDMKFLHSFCDYKKDEYKQEFPDSELSSVADWSEIGDSPSEWLEKDGIRVVEYWYIDAKPDTVYLLKDGSETLKSKLGEDFDEETDERLARDEKGELLSRPTKIPVVKCCTHNAVEVLDEQEWEGRWIPFVPVLGDELDVDGKLILEGMVRHAKGAVQMGNVMASTQMDLIGMIPKSPRMVAEGQIPEEYRHMWETAHNKVWPFLVYKATDSEGHVLQPPIRDIAEPAVQAVSEARLLFNDDVKAVTGINDAQTGARSNETSGYGIRERKQQGELGNFHYVDNLTRAIRQLGKILVDLIPKIYDAPRVMRIIGEDGTPKTQLINGSKLADSDPRKAKLKHFYDLDLGTYDVTVSAGPSYQTKRLEAVATQLELLKVIPPETGAMLLDLIASNMDLPGSELIVERLKKLLPPGLADDDENAQPIPPQAKQKIVQSQQMIQQLTEQLNAAKEIIQTKRVEADTKIQIEKLKIEAGIFEAEITTKAQSQSERAEFLHDLEQTLLNHGHDYAMLREKQGHEAQQAAAAQQHTAEMAQQGSALAMQQAEHAQAIAPTDSEGAE
jgi:hypothetical protein